MMEGEGMPSRKKSKNSASPKLVSQSEIIDVLAILEPTILLDEIAKGFIGYSSNKVTVANVAHLALDSHDDLRGDACIKSGYVQGAEIWVVKVASGWPNNAERFNLSNSQGCMLVFSQLTGALESVLADGGLLTDTRTACAASLCVREFAPTGPLASIAIVGPGVVATLICEQLPQLQCVHGQSTELIVIGRSEERARSFGEKARSFGWGVVTCASVEASSAPALLSRAQVVITCTPATTPLLLNRNACSSSGKLIVALGADAKGKRELGPAVFQSLSGSDGQHARKAADGGGGGGETGAINSSEAESTAGSTAQPPLVIADSLSQCTEFGECASAIADGVLDPTNILELGACLCKVKSGGEGDATGHRGGNLRANADRDVIVDLTGVAVQDVVIASLIVEALK